MKTVFHEAKSRGYADHGWLKSHHSFSFAGYFNPDRIHFGTLRVLNDDFVEGGMGFGKHPHKNMEIISIPLEGDLQHGDDMGNSGIIRRGDIQVMSAGRGVIHSEKNANSDRPVKFLQIWIYPDTENVAPRYDQINYLANRVENGFQQVVSPDRNDAGAWIHQQAWFSLGNFRKGLKETYHIHREGNGAYVFVISGEIRIGAHTLKDRDALGIWDTAGFEIEAQKDAEFLVMDIPMELPDFAA
ncbi:MAG: pirin family protein [Chitinophagaceae bacterium]|nr:pirin family protein [Chitinophagaceae bacterium]MCW5913466.1 pirin family protein [Chitinophagaceae bacterium]MCZ2395780.1 pirin family protein [Chitinophagales bacterium]